MVARRTESSTVDRWGPADEQLLRQLLAPPDLDDGVQSLDYWHRRSRQLPWYRIGARREAARMTARWEQRVAAGLVFRDRTPFDSRVSAGVLVARTRLARWTRRVAIVVVATVTSVIVLVAIPAVAALVYLLQAL